MLMGRIGEWFLSEQDGFKNNKKREINPMTHGSRLRSSARALGFRFESSTFLAQQIVATPYQRQRQRQPTFTTALFA
jgi:hypothetical protein